MVRITSKEAQGMKDAYSKMYAPKEEPKPDTEAKQDAPAPSDAEEKSDK
jgi:hypothetical protein